MNLSAPIARRIVIATHNDGKMREFDELLRPYGLEVISAGQLGLPSPEETGTTFAENALLKARASCLATGELAVADDSGLCVTALGGRPGLYSARWAEPGKNFVAAMRRINDELGNATDRSAHFICVLALVWPDGRSETVAGRIDGIIAPAPRGAGGHGYDAIFIPAGDTRTFAEMDDAEKNLLSHRGKATRLLVEKFFAGSKDFST